VLFGQRSFSATQLLNVGPSSNLIFGLNSANTLDYSTLVAVFNLDAQAGISYWVTRNFKLTASYRFDGYWGALSVLENGVNVNQSRFYFGPMLRATVHFPP
jgi:hypothetical protein